VQNPRALIVAVAMICLAVVAPMSSAALSRLNAGGNVVVRMVNGNNGSEPTNGGVAGKGRFTARGAITDRGTVVTYRWVKGSLITLRSVAAGTKGTIIFVVKIDTSAGTARWTVASGTKAYKSLHGHGTEKENADYTVSTLTGTVSR
jgi:hypothetical protein